jgi:hypothetical protein
VHKIPRIRWRSAEEVALKKLNNSDWEARRNSMKSKILLVLGVLFVMSTLVYAVDPTGKWTGEIPGGRGAQMVAFEFKVAGSTLTGTMTVGQGMPVDITNGKVVDANTITFTAAGGGRGGGGGGGGRGGAGGPGGGAPPAAGNNFAAPQGGGGGGQGGGGGRGGGGGGAQNYTGKFTSATKLHMSRVPAAPPAEGAPAPMPVEFDLTKG